MREGAGVNTKKAHETKSENFESSDDTHRAKNKRLKVFVTYFLKPFSPVGITQL